MFPLKTVRIIVAMGACATLLSSCVPGNDVSSQTQVSENDLAESWADFRDRYLEGYFRLDPTFAVYQGRHDFDGKLPDITEGGLEAQADFQRKAIAHAEAFDPKKMTRADAFERDYLIAVARAQLFWDTDADLPHRNVTYYVGLLDPNTYVTRNYADAPTRLKALTEFLEQVPGVALQMRKNLKTPMPMSFIKFGVAGFNGLADYYLGDAKAAFASVKDPALQSKYDAAAKRAAKAMTEAAKWVEAQRPTATQDFALGAERFARMLRETEMVDIPIDQLEAIGVADLKKNQSALQEACARFAPGRSMTDCMSKMNDDKSPEGPVGGARRQIVELRSFVLANNIVSIPGNEEALVEESPPYNRQNIAYMDPPGPYETGIPSIYYISPPDPAWSEKVQSDFVSGEKKLLFTTIHEVMPGHFLQFLHANRSPSIFGRVFVGYAYAEGWAHYAEEMMWDAGYGKGDPETHIGQLSEALLRNCRFISAIRLHTGRMTQAESKAFFMEQCYQFEGEAEQQAARGTYDPAYLNYTMGKLLIRKLRDDWTKGRGGRAAWKDFHDEFLSYGGPPIPLVRQHMMGEERPLAVF